MNTLYLYFMDIILIIKSLHLGKNVILLQSKCSSSDICNTILKVYEDRRVVEILLPSKCHQFESNKLL